MTAPPAPTLTEAFALLLGELGLGHYRPGTGGGTVFIGGLPTDPDVAIDVRLLRGPSSDPRHGYDEPGALFRIRGAPDDPVGAERAAWALYDAVHGLRRRTLPDGTVLLSCHGEDSGPLPVGPDTRRRYQWSVQVVTELRRRTANRT